MAATPTMVDATGRWIKKEELALHNKEDDIWILVNGHVWDITGFLDLHPGTRKPLMHYAGTDGSEGFNKVHKDLDPSKMEQGVKYIGTYVLTI